MSDLPDPDSRAYRALVLNGRLNALNDLAGLVSGLSDRLEEADDPTQVMVDNWRELFVWMEQAGDEARGELAMLRQEGSPGDTWR
mgnify:CR=1 FL=1